MQTRGRAVISLKNLSGQKIVMEAHRAKSKQRLFAGLLRTLRRVLPRLSDSVIFPGVQKPGLRKPFQEQVEVNEAAEGFPWRNYLPHTFVI